MREGRNHEWTRMNANLRAEAVFLSVSLCLCVRRKLLGVLGELGVKFGATKNTKRQEKGFV